MKKNKKTPAYVSKRCGNIIHVFDPIFMRNFYAVIGVSHERFRAIMKKELNATFEPADSDGKFYVIEKTKRKTLVGVIWSSDRSTNLMHECLHATFWSLRRAGIDATLESEEAFTYHQAFLFKAIKSPS